MKNLILALLLVLTLSILDAAAQSQVPFGRSGAVVSTALLSRPAVVDRANPGGNDRLEGAVAPSGRSNADILKDLYRERYEEPFWKR